MMNLYEENERSVMGVPLGLILLVVTLLAMCGVFICCLYWDRIPLHAPPTHHNNKPSPHHLKASMDKVESLPVMMPGDQVPSFIAMACPCKPPVALDTINIHLDKPPIVTFPAAPPLL